MGEKVIVWPSASVQLSDGRVRFLYPDGATARMWVRGGVVWPRVVGPVQRDGYMVVAAMDADEDDPAARMIRVYEHGPFSAISPILRDGRVARPGMIPMVMRSQSRYAAHEFWCEDGGDARDYWRGELRALRTGAYAATRFRLALAFGPERATHELWRCEQSGRCIIPRDMHEAQAAAQIAADSGKGVGVADNAPRYALALAIYALGVAGDRSDAVTFRAAMF